ncbi:Glioma pathoproteinsis- protein 1 [Bulinus truncatus]|nr:Glioma pathoproteinsis- protein 1 [Bulinus truncatus]
MYQKVKLTDCLIFILAVSCLHSQSSGQEIQRSHRHFDPEEAVRFWWNEIEYYNYEDNSCSRNCLHYTQVVWANSYAVGCGVKFCPKLKQFKYGQGFFVVCQYGPAGNVIGQKPFKRGSRCSECPAEANTCLDKLCVRSPRADRLRYSTNSSIDRLWTWWQLLTVFGCCVLMNRNFHI